MFSKVKKPAEKKTLTELMTFIVTGTQSPAGCAIVPHNFAKEIEKYEPTFIKVSSDPDPAGNVSVFATSLGVAAVTGTSPVEAAVTPKSEFVIEDGFVPPASKRGGIKSDTYPFAALGVGQSFFVPATAERPNPAKGLASTVSSATKRFAAAYPSGHAQAGQPTGKDGRKFTVRARTTADGEKSNGARVYRTQ